MRGMDLYRPPRSVPVDGPGPVQDRPHGHHEEALEDHVVEGVGHGAVDGKGRTQADAHHHEADLVDHGVGEDPAQVVLDDGVEDGEHRHGDPHPDQELRTREGPGQGVHRHLGGEGGKEDGARGCCLRIGVHEPVVQERESGLDAEGQKNEPGGQAVQAQELEGDAPGLVGVNQDTGQEKHPAHHAYDQVTDS